MNLSGTIIGACSQEAFNEILAKGRRVCKGSAYIIDAAEYVVRHVHLEHEEGADDKDDDGVHVGRCEGCLEATNCRIDHGRKWNNECHGCAHTQHDISGNKGNLCSCALPLTQADSCVEETHGAAQCGCPTPSKFWEDTSECSIRHAVHWTCVTFKLEMCEEGTARNRHNKKDHNERGRGITIDVDAG